MEDSTKRNPSVANQVSSSSHVSDGIGEVNIVIPKKASQNSVTSQNRRPGKRRIEKVPPLLRKDKKNKNCYYPQVVSLGPYHHGKKKLKLVEDFKPTVLEMFVSDNDKHTDDFYKKVFEVIDEARSGYVDGSTDSYKDEAFAKMMLLDGCFILYLIDCYIGVTPWNMLLDHLGALTTATLFVDVLLLENRLPFIVLQNNQQTEVNQEEKQQPLHLLEAYWTRILTSELNKPLPQTLRYMCDRWRKKSPVKHYITEYVPTICSVTELKAKEICVRPSKTRTLHDVKFKSYWFYGQLELPTLFATWDTKIWFLNTIAYEMGPNNPRMYNVTSYFAFMK
ncbi:hypothetical protein F0562_017549 [Nyssa sinensis]|uniref:Uncharacterized protein n=1 Tax=Nyssa sinensis TaxID=561372 RepID=A0A5J4ZGQ9_9ASTE|nr:hypothetical protein F0562_017549 [Nyssa sinensis]